MVSWTGLPGLCCLALLLLTTAATSQFNPAVLLSRPAFLYQPALPRSLLNRARVNNGDDRRLQKFIDKLIDGVPVKYAVVGSSIATARGATTEDGPWPVILHKWLEMAFTTCAEERAGTNFQTTDPTYIANKNMCSRSTVTYVDMAVPGSSPLFSEKCVAHKVPEDVDLVLIEYGVNDFTYARDDKMDHNYQLHTTERKALERMYRRVLSVPSKPAVVLFEPYSLAAAMASLSSFSLLPEDYHVVYAQYYGNIQTLSVRNVLYHKIMQMGQKAMVDAKWYIVDTIHPGDEGHKLYADILINYIQQLASEAVDRRMALGNVLGRTLLPLEKDAEVPLPPPMNHNNYESSAGFCKLSDEMNPLVAANQGFSLVDEGGVLANGVRRHKWGYITQVPGSKLTLKLDTTLGGYASATDTISVMIAHLKSYEHMGKASVTCVAGCQCVQTIVDAHSTAQRVSLTSFASVPVTPHADCTIEVEVLPTTSSGEHKFKVIGVVVHNQVVGREQSLLGTDHGDYIDFKVAGSLG